MCQALATVTFRVLFAAPAAVPFTAISYGKLVRQFPEAGSAHTYAQKSINPHVGFIWSAGHHCWIISFCRSTFCWRKSISPALFPEVPPWVWVVTFVAILHRCESEERQPGRELQYPVCVGGNLHHGGVYLPGGFRDCIKEKASARSGRYSRLSARTRISFRLLPWDIVRFSFLGFDAVTTLSEETPDAARVIPKAIFLTAVYGGVMDRGVVFFMQLSPPLVRLTDPDAALPEIALYVGGKLFELIFLSAPRS
ncbi:hypothetical protein ACNKHX_08020 [Shigella flexneri]